MLTQAKVKEYLKYEDGHLWWKKKSHPMSRVTMGNRAGKHTPKGYIVVTLLGRNYLEHRLIWLYHCGEWPEDQLDHINGVRDDNRIENLRQVTNQQNQFNKKSANGSSSQYKGVYWNKNSGKWHSRCQTRGSNKHLGFFDCELEAAKAYDDYAKSLHGAYANPNLGE